jgi:hypothetical protein
MRQTAKYYIMPLVSDILCSILYSTYGTTGICDHFMTSGLRYFQHFQHFAAPSVLSAFSTLFGREASE